MRRLLLAVWFVFAVGGLRAQTADWQPSPGHTQIAIWPGTPPDALPTTGQEQTVTDTKIWSPGGRGLVINNVSKPDHDGAAA